MATNFTIVVLMTVVSVVLVDSRVVKNPPPRPRRTSPLPPTHTTPWITTLPPGCRADNGQVLYPGQQKTFVYEGGCQTCTCSYLGSLSCYVADCLIPMCTDSHIPHGACCATCPNGRTCRIPMTGEVIQVGQREEKDGMLCECPPQNYMLPGIQSEADYTAICIPATTIPPTATTTPSVPVGRR